MQLFKTVQMYPTAIFKGANLVARFSSIVIATPGSLMVLGSQVILEGLVRVLTLSHAPSQKEDPFFQGSY